MSQVAERLVYHERDAGTKLRCDCCGRETLGEVQPYRCLYIYRDLHGARHEVRVEARELLERLAGTQDGSAILAFVRAVVL